MPRRNNTLKFTPFRAQNCESKRKYNTENEAKQTAEYQMLITKDLELSVYKCDLCQKWHLTSIKN